MKTTDQASAKLEQLIVAYENVIWSTPLDMPLAERLCKAVEDEANRIGYTDHRRLYALHTAFEQAADRAERRN